jgi:hypothetical protein
MVWNSEKLFFCRNSVLLFQAFMWLGPDDS